MNILLSKAFFAFVVGSSGVEPPTSCLSGMRSNLLSYEPFSLVSLPRHLVFVLLLFFSPLVEMKGIEPLTPCLQGRCSPSWATPPYSWDFLTVPENRTTNFFNALLLVVFFVFFVSTRILPYSHVLHRKEVIQPHLPIRLPCYDLTPITEPTFGSCPLAVSSLTSGVSDFHGLTGGVYKARERIHRGMLIRDY